MINFERVADRIFKVLKGHGYQVKLFADDGSGTIDPEQARRFYVDEPNLMVTLDVDNEEIIFNKNTNEALSVYEKALQQVKQVSNHYMLNFTLKEFGKKIEPKDFAYQAKNVKETNMNQVTEASLSKMFGSKKTSRQTLENVQIMVKHKKAVDEEVRGSRARNIHSIFLECNGERMRFPHNHLGGARAMARHVAMGGAMNDQLGEHIVESTGNYIRLKEFMRYVRSNKLLSEDSSDVVSLVQENLNTIAHDLQRLAGAKSYSVASARIAEQTVTELNETDTDKFKDMFTVKRFDEKFNDVLPLVSQLVQEKESFLRKIEESSEGTITLIPQMQSSLSAAIRYESKAAELGNRVKDISSRISENKDLARYVSGLGDKIVSETQLSEFEQSILSRVLQNSTVQQLAEKKKGLMTESFNPYKAKFDKYDNLFLK